MPGIEYGFRAAIFDVLSVIITFIIIEASLLFAQIGCGWISYCLKLIIVLIGITSLEAIEHWGLLYTIGYIIGYIFMVRIFGFDILDIIVIIVAVCFAIIKTVRKLTALLSF